jgi:hypothetical protein
MRLQGIKEGDVVQCRDDASLWLVNHKGEGRLYLFLPRSHASRTAKPREIVAHWSRRKGGK